MSSRERREMREHIAKVAAMEEQVASLEDKIDKLRDLVRDMYKVMTTDAANCDVTYPEQFDDQMHELGIEV